MATSEPEDDVDDGSFRAPLPMDDRLWRHPSELAEHPRRSFLWRLLHPMR